MAKYGFGESSAVENIFDENISNDESSFTTLSQRQENLANYNTGLRSGYSTDLSETSIENVRLSVFFAEKMIIGLIKEIEDNMSKVTINPYAWIDLENAHNAVWKDVVKENQNAKTKQKPNFIIFEEYTFAEKHLCRACRNFIKEYELSVVHTTFGHLLEARKALSFLLRELSILKNIVTYYIGEEYRDATEAQIAKHISDWSSSATHYTKLIATEITSTPASIPQSELDQISKKQAAQFQAFFSIKVNSYTAEIDTLLNLIKRDSVETSDTFYNKYLMPALSVKSKIVDPMLFDISTTNIKNDIPTLLKEVFVATSSITGNLGAVTSDMVQRNVQIYKRFDALMQAIRLKRRYVSYMVQLEAVGAKRKANILAQEAQEADQYRSLFINTAVDSSARTSLRSSHNDLDDIDGDAHPQYLRIDGGTIKGDIFIEEGIRIAGIDLANHTHNGEDGSNFISSSSIDYESGREQYYDASSFKPYSNLNLVSLNSTTLIGGVPQYEAVFEIEINDDNIDSYEFEILYKEI